MSLRACPIFAFPCRGKLRLCGAQPIAQFGRPVLRPLRPVFSGIGSRLCGPPIGMGGIRPRRSSVSAGVRGSSVGIGRISPLFRLIGPLPLKICRHFCPIGPLPLAFKRLPRGVQHPIWTGVQRTFGRVFNTRPRPDLGVIGDQHLHSAEWVVIGPSARPFPPERQLADGFGRDTEAHASFRIREPIGHCLNRVLDGCRTAVHVGGVQACAAHAYAGQSSRAKVEISCGKPEDAALRAISAAPARPGGVRPSICHTAVMLVVLRQGAYLAQGASLAIGGTEPC